MVLKNNDQKTQISKFHINQLPSDRIFILLEQKFHKEIFSRIEYKKLPKINKLFFKNHLNAHTVKQWKSRKHFIPLWFLIKLNKLFPEYSIQKIEKNILAYRGPSTSAIIKNPDFPIKEDSRLLKIMAHLLGDGSVGGGFGSNLPKGKQHSEYRNFTPELLDGFERDLSVFGEVPTTKNYERGTLIIPNLIGYILEHIYNIKFDTFNSRIPEKLFEIEPELIAFFLRAFADDEGHVYDSSIDYYSNNKKLLTDILSLINKAFTRVKTSNIKINTKAGKNTKYSFTIYSDSLQVYSKLIGFDHKEKMEDLQFNLNRKGKKPNKNPKEKILKLLENDNLSAKQISRIMESGHTTILSHLNELKRKGNIKVIKKERWANIWGIDEGKN
ncbi:LAGLIDADG family homing endonuclease [Nanoarchaeota archaeon]